MTTTEIPRALTIWNHMNPSDRLSVMNQVKGKAIQTKFRNCIKFIENNYNNYSQIVV